MSNVINVKQKSENERLFLYIPFSLLYLWKASTGIKYLVFLVLFIPLIYGFLGIKDPFNIFNYIIIVPLYFALASTIVRELYQRLDEIYGPSNSFHLSKTFPRK